LKYWIEVSKVYFEIPPHGTSDNIFLLSLEVIEWVIEKNE
jgi:hypothetical protein